MNFEHLIEINDPNNMLLEPLSRNQLWQGLILRAEKPELSAVGLDTCTVLERRPNYMHRELRFGTLRVYDEVFFEPMQTVRYEIMASEHFTASTLSMRIEEPHPGRFFIRFIYANIDDKSDKMVREHLEQAYIQADIDTVGVIRELAKMGKLGPYLAPNEQGPH